jgi:hypothetical protein
MDKAQTKLTNSGWLKWGNPEIIMMKRCLPINKGSKADLAGEAQIIYQQSEMLPMNICRFSTQLFNYIRKSVADS